MKLLDVNSKGGTCDRCGKGLTNVAVISDSTGIHTVGLDCLGKVTELDWETKQAVNHAIKDARELAQVKKLASSGELCVKFEQAGGGEVAYWYDPKRSWRWVGLAEQNTKGLRKEMYALIQKAK